MVLMLRNFFYAGPTRNRTLPYWRAWPYCNTIETALAEHVLANRLPAPLAFELQFRSADRLWNCGYGHDSKGLCNPPGWLAPNESGLWVSGPCQRCFFGQPTLLPSVVQPPTLARRNPNG